MGCWYGSAKAWTDLPRMCDLYLAGRLNLDDLVSRSYPLEEINEAYDALAAATSPGASSSTLERSVAARQERRRPGHPRSTFHESSFTSTTR